VLSLKSLRKVLAVDLEAAKRYLKDFAEVDKDKAGELYYEDFVKLFHNKDTDELW